MSFSLFQDPLILGLLVLNIVPLTILFLVHLFRSEKQNSLSFSPSPTLPPSHDFAKIRTLTSDEALNLNILQKNSDGRSSSRKNVVFMTNFKNNSPFPPPPPPISSPPSFGTTRETTKNEYSFFSENPTLNPSSVSKTTKEMGEKTTKEGESFEVSSSPTSSVRCRKPTSIRSDLRMEDRLDRTLSPNTPLDFGVESTLNSPVTPGPNGLN